MAPRWKRWIAAVLLAYTATTAVASACAITCVMGQAAVAPSSHCHHEGSPPAGACPLSELCGFAFAPAVAPDVRQADILVAAYIPFPIADVLIGVDPAPPLKPPPA